MGTEPLPVRTAYRPVIRAARLGVHCASTLKLSSRIPSAASWSILGVGAPRRIPPPYTPGSPQPRLSITTTTIFGFFPAPTDLEDFMHFLSCMKLIHGRYFSRRHPYNVEVYEHRAAPTTSKTASPRAGSLISLSIHKIAEVIALSWSSLPFWRGPRTPAI